jgi:CubicO group peptidase (beta-lactamase class C family)
VALMAANHLSPAMLPYASGPRVYTGYGFGLGVGVLLDPAQAHVLGSAGSYGWSGMAGTWFRVDPQEEMVLLFMPQLINAPDISRRHEEFQVLAYQALVDPLQKE